MEKLCTSKTFSKWRVGGCITFILPLAISYRHHQKSLTYFSRLVKLILFFFTKRRSRKGEGHGTMAPLNTVLSLRLGL